LLKENLLPILILSFFVFSIKSFAVAHPEYINGRAQPREFVISLYEGIHGSVMENNTLFDNMASTINFDSKSLLKLFWLFIDSPNYQYPIWVSQLKECQVFYEYVTSGTVEKYSYYVAKQPTGANIFTEGMYTFGIAMAVRDFKATYNTRTVI